MNRLSLTLAAALAPLGLAHAAGGEAPLAPTALQPTVLPTAADEVTFKVYYKNALRVDSSDGRTKLKIGGRIFNDWSWFSAEDALGTHEDGTEFRAARLYVSGTIDERYEFKANYDFASTKAGDGGPGFKDVYMGLKKIPVVQNIRVGHFKEPMGLEELTSSKYITFMERSLKNNLDRGRNTGLMVHGHNKAETMTFAAGVFRESDNFGKDTSNSGYAFTARVTGTPMANEDHTSLIHLGASASYRNHSDGSVRINPRPESHLAPKYIDTGTIAADSELVYGVEWASVHGPFSTQAEYAINDVDGVSGGASPAFASYYGQVSWFATGESRTYEAGEGAFGRVKPKNPWGNGGNGAWELAARYSTIDLNDDTVTGGEQTDITVGVNWYLSSFARTMFNYVNADVDGVGSADIFMIRFQIDF
ncbi:MAG: porin [Planctomycetes bacterium]|nr:porin [Planctomycetota bacterium]